MLIRYNETGRLAKDSLIDGFGGDGGTAGLGGKLLHGRPIFDGGLMPDGFRSLIFYVYARSYVTLKRENNGLVKFE